jgi:pSer/pThr/pTyr-binding forkhead associated (FHA) protein
MDETIRIDDINDSVNDGNVKIDEKSKYCLQSLNNYNTKELQLKYGINKIGRSDECDVIITNASLSKVHAVIEIQEKGCFISDNNSSNKTRKNSVPLKENVLYEIKEDDILQFGSEQFKFMSQVNQQEQQIDEQNNTNNLEYDIKNTLEDEQIVNPSDIQQTENVSSEAKKNNDELITG